MSRNLFFRFHPPTQSLSRPRDLDLDARPHLEKKNGKKIKKKKKKISTHVEREDLQAFLTSPGAAEEAMSLLDVDGDGR